MDPISFELPIDRAWGFFNDAYTKETDHFHAPPYVIRPFPDKLFEAVGDELCIDRGFIFDRYWRFDLLRPLYSGRAEYFREFLYLITSPVIILDIFKVAYKLLENARWRARHMIPVILFMTIPALIYAIIITALSMTLSLLGLIIRPMMTLLLGTNDEDLTVRYDCDCHQIKGGEKNVGLYVDITYTFLKGNCPTQYTGTIRRSLPLNLPDSARFSRNITINFTCETDCLQWNANWTNHKFDNDHLPVAYETNAKGQIARSEIEDSLKQWMKIRIYYLTEDERRMCRHERSNRLFNKGSEDQVEYENYVQASERKFWCR